MELKVWFPNLDFFHIQPLITPLAVATVLSNWHNVLRAISMASSKLRLMTISDRNGLKRIRTSESASRESGRRRRECDVKKRRRGCSFTADACPDSSRAEWLGERVLIDQLRVHTFDHADRDTLRFIHCLILRLDLIFEETYFNSGDTRPNLIEYPLTLPVPTTVPLRLTQHSSRCQFSH